jgi:hypothetical protein
MDNKFLDKVVDQIVYETMVDYSVGVFTPFNNRPFVLPINDSRFFTSPISPSKFDDHCKEVYGLKGIEVDYVWGEYVITLSNKIKNNG